MTESELIVHLTSLANTTRELRALPLDEMITAYEKAQRDDARFAALTRVLHAAKKLQLESQALEATK